VTPITFTIPGGFPATKQDVNQLTEEAFLLGRKLFHDGRLSKDGNFPCSSCHQQLAAFTTFEHDRSHGYNNSHTLRNAPALFNLAWYPVFNQDGRTATLDAISLAHITAEDEMGETIAGVLAKLKDDDEYKEMFSKAYGSKTITTERMLNALTQYLLNLVSAESKYDKVKKGQEVFTAEEQNGYVVFQSKCVTCHTEPLFTDFSFRNTGLPIDNLLKDYGRFRVTGNSSDSMKFRVPSLRNLNFSSYYSHDGRFSFPRMMIQHYRDGVQPGTTVDPIVANGIPLTTLEENNLIYFLRTLSDSSFIMNSKYME
jgi:cytochrome c peroxidase